MYRLTGFRSTQLLLALLLIMLTSAFSACGTGPCARPLQPDAALVVSDGVAYIGLLTTVVAVHTNDGSQLWSATVGGDASFATLANGVLYVGSGAILTALRSSDGMRLWQFKGTGPSPQLKASNPLVSDGIVYAASITTVCALQASDGKLLWQYATGLASSPAPLLTLSQGTLYVYNREAYVALQASNGSVRWKMQRSIYAFGLSESGAQTYLYEATTVVALRNSDGQQLWSFPLPVKGISYLSMAVAQGNVYVGVRDTLYALRETDGKQLWSAPVDGYVTPIVVNSVLYTRSSGDDNSIALDASTGARIWQSPNRWYEPIVVDSVRGAIYAVAFDANTQQYSVLAMKTSDGSVLWTSSDVYAAARLLNDGVVYFATSSGGCGNPTASDIYAVQARDGSDLWHVHVQP